jgi:hypothetical protein
MIQSLAILERWRVLLEDEIPRELALYNSRLANGTATAAWHAQAAQQCTAWLAEIAAMQASAVLPIFQGCRPYWTSTAIAAMVTDLQAIQASLGTATAPTVLAANLA